MIRARFLDDILLIELTDPSGYPRLGRAVVRQLQQKFQEAHSLPRLRGVVLTGSETCFAAGAELSEIAQLTPTEAKQFAEMGQRLMRTIERLSKPVMAAVRGYCLGGGFDLAMACHARVAASDAVFGHPGGSLGIMTGWGGTQRLTRIVGRGRALELLATGKQIIATEAYAWRLVSKAVIAEQVVEEVLRMLRSRTEIGRGGNRSQNQ